MTPHRLVALAMAAAATAVAVSASQKDDSLIVEGLSADQAAEACSVDSEDSCAVELRQLRAAERKAVVSEHEHQEPEAAAPPPEAPEEEGAEVGEEAQGRKMWAETTWEEILLELKANASGSCVQETGGSCAVFGCRESRGTTQCTMGKCMCPEGYCSMTGICFPQAGQCMSDTGGTCSVTGCKSSRGSTKCKEGKCLCKTGGCAFKGKCYPVTDTGGTCSVSECSTSRGETTCHKERCLCKDGFVAVQGRCEPFSL